MAQEGSMRKWENRSLKVDLSLTMGWLPLRLRNTIGGGIPGMEAMFFGITNDHSNYMQRPKRGSTRKCENRSLKVNLLWRWVGCLWGSGTPSAAGFPGWSLCYLASQMITLITCKGPRGARRGNGRTGASKSTYLWRCVGRLWGSRTILGLQRIIGQDNFGIEIKFWSWKKFWIRKKICVRKKFVSKRKFQLEKNFGSENNFCPKEIMYRQEPHLDFS